MLSSLSQAQSPAHIPAVSMEPKCLCGFSNLQEKLVLRWCPPSLAPGRRTWWLSRAGVPHLPPILHLNFWTLSLRNSTRIRVRCYLIRWQNEVHILPCSHLWDFELQEVREEKEQRLVKSYKSFSFPSTPASDTQAFHPATIFSSLSPHSSGRKQTRKEPMGMIQGKHCLGDRGLDGFMPPVFGTQYVPASSSHRG